MHIKEKILFSNGNILTMNDEEQQVEAIAVEDGIIVCCGDYDTCKDYLNKGYTEVDLQGKALLPGFIDPHVHFFHLGMLTSWADLTYPNCQSIEDMIRILKEYADTLPEGAMICGYGFDQRKLKEQRFPTAKDLDRITDNRCVKIMHISGHGLVVNSYYMNLMGIDKNTEDVEGGVIFRDKLGNPEGIFYDAAADYLVDEKGVKVGIHGISCHTWNPMELNIKYLIKAQNIALKAGLTTIQDPQVTKLEMQVYNEGYKRGIIKSRLVGSYYSCYFEELKKLGMWGQIGNDIFRLNGLKLYADGSLLSGTTFIKQGYKPGIKTEGHLFHKKEDLISLIKEAHSYGFQTVTHVTGNVAIDYVIEAVRDARTEHPEINLRHRIEHCGLATKEQIKEMAKLDIWPVPQPNHFFLYGQGVVKAVGDAGEDYNPYGWFKEFGVPIVISSDAPVSLPDIFTSIYTAVTRKTVDGTVIGEHQKISIMDALLGCTLNAAKAIHLENEIGSIQDGKKADFVVTDINPLKCDEEKIKDIQILQTWVGGKLMYDKENNGDGNEEK